jgi:ABC-type transport system involved in cytochrome c biogenesis permease subunit
MRAIYQNESQHFPVSRTLNFVSTLSLLFITSMMMGSKYQREDLVPAFYSYAMLAFFIIYSIISTIYNAKVLKKIHEVKRT